MKQAGRLSLALCALLSALPRAQTDIDQSSAMAVTNTTNTARQAIPKPLCRVIQPP